MCQTIPSEIDDNEIILRSVFSKMVLRDTRQSPGVRANAFNPYPKEKGEISVNRLDYTTADFCKIWSKKEIKVDDEYHGFASLFCKSIKAIGASVKYTPLQTNKFHSDILLGYHVEKGDPIPTRYSQIKTNLAKHATLHSDNCPNDTNWCGPEIKPRQ